MPFPLTIQSQLCLRRIELSVYLGWPDEERKQKQTVYVDIDIFFSEPPLACQTDDLQNTLCYATLIAEIEIYLEMKHFRLVERLTQDIYQFVKSRLSPHTRCLIHLTKYPAVPQLSEGVRFSYGDQ